jgi:hypothetical protein
MAGDTAVLRNGESILLLDSLHIVRYAAVCAALAVQRDVDSGGQIVGVLMQVSDLAARPRDAGAARLFLGCLCGYLANGFSLMGSERSV